jgi:hypothetical protein
LKHEQNGSLTQFIRNRRKRDGQKEREKSILFIVKERDCFFQQVSVAQLNLVGLSQAEVSLGFLSCRLT